MAMGKAGTKKKTKRKKTTKRVNAKSASGERSGSPKYPRHSLEKSLRVPKAILEQNAGRECSEGDAASFVGVGLAGPFRLELSSAIKFGLLNRTSPRNVELTDLAKTILRPQKPQDEINGLRKAVLNAPQITDVYSHYRGENLPDKQFFENALVDNFGIPQGKVAEFSSILIDSLRKAQLVEEHDGKFRIIDATAVIEDKHEASSTLKKLGKSATVNKGDSCFVMMPFADPHGSYYSSIYEPAIEKTGLRAIRADADIFGTGKIMDQIWSGINSAKVLVAELTTRNPNVFYELGLAHALHKPVVLVSSNEDDVPFDLGHIRVIYYNVEDPFWGKKLIEKVAENILSAITNPEEAIFKAGVGA